MSKNHRRVDRDSFWQETIAAWKASGQTITAFCAAHGLAEATFYAKRRDLDRHVPTPTRSTPPASPTFAAVRVIADPTVEVLVPCGVVLRVPVGADPAAVARLVLALRGEPC